jgi:hypothetical protein
MTNLSVLAFGFFIEETVNSADWKRGNPFTRPAPE